MTTLQFSASVVSRVPQQSAAPLFEEVGHLHGAYGLSLKEVLNKPAELTVSFLPDDQDPDVKQWLLDPSHEVWLWRDGVRVFAGPTVSRQAQLANAGVVMSLQCRDRLHYLWRRIIDPATGATYTNTDQTLIAKALVDLAQTGDYSDYGIDASGVVASGVLRDRTYAAGTIHRIGQRLTELAEVGDGFDFWVDPTDFDFDTAYPERGVDRTGTIVLDRSNIVSPRAAWSMGIEDVATHAWALSSGGSTQVRGTATNPAALLQSYGRADVAATFQGVTTQGTIDDHADRLAAERAAPLYEPAPAGVLLVGFGIEDFGLGDTIEVAYDYGLGLEETVARVVARTTKIEDDGNLLFGVELL